MDYDYSPIAVINAEAEVDYISKVRALRVYVISKLRALLKRKPTPEEQAKELEDKISWMMDQDYN